MDSKRRNGPKRTEKCRFYVAYYRVSTVRQGESGLGLDAQRAAVARYLASVGGELLLEFTEIESGKRHTNRPQLAAAIEASRGKQAILLIAKLDRLARNVAFISGLMESAAEFVACDIPHANRLTIHILAAIAEHEREMISSRTIAALEQAKVRGVKLGNPRWRESIFKAIDAHRRRPGVRELAPLVAGFRAEGLTLQATADRLNGLGIKTPTGFRWFPASVSRFTSGHIKKEAPRK